MGARVYLLLDILENKSENAIQTLRSTEGIVVADRLEGHPNILVAMEAPDREKLCEIMMPVLGSVERITADLHLLMTRENSVAPCLLDTEKIEPFRGQPARTLAVA